jgi:hypothetical protein
MSSNSKPPVTTSGSQPDTGEDPVETLKQVLTSVSLEAAGDVEDVLRTADALSTTWNRLANTGTQKLRPVSDARAEKLLGNGGR